jgi:hypothetical protein
VFSRLTQAGTFFTAGYRPDDLRAWKRSTSSGNTTYYLYDGSLLLHEIDSSGHLVSSYGWGAAGLVEKAANSTRYAYSFNPSAQ